MGGVNFMIHGAGRMEGGLHASLEKMILDADLTMPPEDLPKFYEAIREAPAQILREDPRASTFRPRVLVAHPQLVCS